MKCSTCKNDKLPDEFSTLSSGKKYTVCKRCCVKRASDWYWKNRESALSRRLAEHKRRRREAIEAVGKPVCVCCGESRFSMLDIDHINGGGRKHRLSFKSDWKFYKDVAKNPTGLQILCCNCNHSKRRLGHCEHEDERMNVASIL